MTFSAPDIIAVLINLDQNRTEGRKGGPQLAEAASLSAWSTGHHDLRR